jgi:hypothetical protein
MHILSHVCELASNWRPNTKRVIVPPYREEGWLPTDHGFWAGLYWLLYHDWFRRPWTFQEAILTPHINIVLGALAIGFSDFNNFLAFVVNGY